LRRVDGVMNNQERKRASDDASDDPDQPIDARPLRCTDGLIDPLLERLKRVHGDPRVAAQSKSAFRYRLNSSPCSAVLDVTKKRISTKLPPERDVQHCKATACD
jgi:hypothetical protein